MNSAVFALYFSFHLDWEKKNRWIESMYTTSPSRRKTKVLLSIGYRKKNHFSLFPIRRLVDYYVDPLWRLIGNLDALRAANTIPEFLHPFEPCTVRYWSKTISPVPFATNLSKNVNNSFKRCSTLPHAWIVTVHFLLNSHLCFHYIRLSSRVLFKTFNTQNFSRTSHVLTFSYAWISNAFCCHDEPCLFDVHYHHDHLPSKNN